MASTEPQRSIPFRGGLSAAVWVVALAKLALHLGFSTRGYGFFGDELYYIACASHLDFGYVDHPPLSIWILSGWQALAGESLAALRVLPAVLGAAAVAVAGALARELGGRGSAQALTALAVALAPVNWVVHGYYSMNAIDILVWELAFLGIARTLRSGRSGSAGQWIALGGLLGIGLLNKFSVMWLGAGLFVGLVATPHRQVLRSPWPWLGGGLAGLLLLPHLLWQAAHGWPTAEFVAAATAHKMVPVSPLDLFGQQVLVWNPLLLPLWLAGFVALLRRPTGDSGRVLAIVYATTAAILIANGTSRPNYLALAAPPLLAAGAVAFERAALRSRRSWTVPAYATLVAVVGLAATPMTLPVLPVTDLLEYSRALRIRAPQMERREIGALDPHFADMHGWERIVETIAEVHSALPPGDRSRAAILATSYSAAGAIDRFGPAYGLPGAISGHNNYWLWGPGKADGSVVIIAGGAREVWEQHWNSVEAAAVWNCGLCLPARNHATVYVARAPKAPLARSWASLRHYH